MYKKTLCLGGSFNPIHHGHLLCTRAVAETGGFDRVLLIPSANPPHKPDVSDLADATHRLLMCRLAIQTTQWAAKVQFEVSDIELSRANQPSYTIDTVRQLKTLGWKQVHWLIGADMLNFLPKWHEAAELLRETDFVIMARPGVPIDWNALPPEFASLKSNVVSASLIDISSSQIRQRLRAGLDTAYLTPPAVVDYINAFNLYRT